MPQLAAKLSVSRNYGHLLFMTKKKVQILIPFLLTSLALVYCWAMLILNGYVPSVKHYTALLLFAALSLVYRKWQLPGFVVALGVYLLLASLHLISLSYKQATFFFGSDSFLNPHFQLASVGIFIVYIFLNLNQLFEIELDWKEKKA